MPCLNWQQLPAEVSHSSEPAALPTKRQRTQSLPIFMWDTTVTLERELWEGGSLNSVIIESRHPCVSASAPQGIICKVVVLAQQPLSPVDMLCALLKRIPHSHTILYVASSSPFPIGKGIVKKARGVGGIYKCLHYSEPVGHPPFVYG